MQKSSSVCRPVPVCKVSYFHHILPNLSKDWAQWRLWSFSGDALLREPRRHSHFILGLRDMDAFSCVISALQLWQEDRHHTLQQRAAQAPRTTDQLQQRGGHPSFSRVMCVYASFCFLFSGNVGLVFQRREGEFLFVFFFKFQNTWEVFEYHSGQWES